MSGEVAFVVLAHKNPAQLRRLCDRLAPAPVFLHLDLNSGDAVVPRPLPENVVLLPRRPIAWAGWSQVEATLLGMRHAVASGARHVVTLSGQDYPLWPVEEVEALLAEEDASFFATRPLPFEFWGRFGGLDRVRLVNLTRKGYHRVPLPIPQRVPLAMKPYGTTAFFTMRADAARHVVDLFDTHPELVRYFKRTWLPAETAIATVFENSPYAGHNINENLWYVEWSGGSHPKTLSGGSFDRMAQAAKGPVDWTWNGPARAKLFARKFDADLDSAVLDRIDAELLHR